MFNPSTTSSIEAQNVVGRHRTLRSARHLSTLSTIGMRLSVDVSTLRRFLTTLLINQRIEKNWPGCPYFSVNARTD